MSRSSREASGGGERGEQPEITDFIDYQCPVCGRTYGDEGSACHPSHITTFERRLATGAWLLPSKRPPDVLPSERPVLGADHVSFECLYLALRSLFGSELAQIKRYFEETPYQSPNHPWIASIYRQHLEEDDELVLGLLAAIRGCETRVEQLTGEIAPPAVFAHMIYLDQYGLIPGYHSLAGRGSLREFCSEYYGVEVGDLDSEWVVERRVDRAKVFSTTKTFRKEWDLELADQVSYDHPHAAYKPFNGSAILADHRDHNLVTRRAKQELLGLPGVDWAVAPHIIYLQSGYQMAEDDSAGKLPILGFDFAGFEYSHDGQKLRYLGIVTDWDECPFEIYLQIVQLGKTDANGIIVMCNRQSIYEFLHFLKTNHLISETDVLPNNLDDYRSIPNVRELHEQVISQIRLLDGMVLIPRRKLMDEGLQTIDELLPVTTYAEPNGI